MRPSCVWYQTLLFFEHCPHGLVFEVLGVVEELHGRVPELWRAVWLTHCAQADGVDADESVVSDYVYPVTLAKVGLVAVADWHLDAVSKAQVVVSRKTGNKFLDFVGRASSGDLILVEEDVAKAVVLVEPVLVAVFLPLLLRRQEAFEVCRPFSSSVKQIAEEQSCVRVDMAL